MLNLYNYLELEDELLGLVHIKYKFILLYNELKERIINENGSLTKKEKEEQFKELSTLYDESLELLTMYKEREVEKLKKEFLDD